MLIDRQLRFSNEQAVTADAASTDLIDLDAARDIGAGTPLWLVVVVTTTMDDTSDNSTCTVSVETDTAAAFSSATTTQTLEAFPAVSVAGTTRIVPLAPFGTAERYMRLKYTMANGDLSAGKFTAFLTTDPHNWRAYADGITVS